MQIRQRHIVHTGWVPRLGLALVAWLAAVTALSGAQGARRDPPALSIESLQPEENGADIFRARCASCHGGAGQGNGPLADQLRKTPPDLTKYAMRNGGVFPSERVGRIIDGRDVPSHGDRDMPVWGDAFRRAARDGSDAAAQARIRALVRFLQAIQERPAE